MADKVFHTAVMAGAGTGKTYSLVENYLCALFGLDQSGEKKRPAEILALTFTQKAAHEMRLRILKRLSEFLSPDLLDDPLISMARDKGVTLPGGEEIKRLLRALPNARIATFHGFCAELLRKEAGALGIDDEFSILSPDEEKNLARNILRPLILEELSSPSSPIKGMVARFRLGNGLVSYGLVDGLLKLYFKLFEKGIGFLELLDLTLTDRVSLDDLHACLDKIKHALDQFFLTKTTPKTKERLLEISSRLSSFQGLVLTHEKNVSQKFLELRKSVSGNFGDQSARQALVFQVVEFGTKLVDYHSLADEASLARILIKFHQQFEEIKRVSAMLSYSDLLTKTKVALLDDLDLRKRIKGSIKHMLVDEYQDTSPLQEDILALLLEDKSSEKILTSRRVLKEVSFQNGPSLFVVGDKKQSIYGFRGADSALFDGMIGKLSDAQKDGSHFSRLLLTTNRRSKKSILTLVNLVAEHTLKIQGYGHDQALEPNTGDDGVCALWVNDDDGEEGPTDANLRCAAFGVAKLLKGDHNARDIVILVRRIRSATVIKLHLLNLGIASRIVGGDGFYEAQEVVDLLSFLRLINHPGDSLALAVVLRSPLVLLKEQEILKIAQLGCISLANVQAVYQQEKLEPSSYENLGRLLTLLESLRLTVAKEGVGQALDQLVKETDYAYVLGLMDNPHQKWANVEKLSSMLSKNQQNPFSLIDEHYDHIFDKSREPLASGVMEEDACTIMTTHQSKGLEFKVVVVADGESAIISNYDDFLADPELGLSIKTKNPLAFCVPSGDEMALTRYMRSKERLRNAEELEMARLLYVAMTRAKDELYIACSKKAYDESSSKIAKTMVGLFLQSLHRSKELFLATASIEFIKKPENLAPRTKSQFKPVKIFSYQKKIRRIFASALVTSDEEIQPLVLRHYRFDRGVIDGDLAHKLLSEAGSAVLAEDHFDDGMIEVLLDAICRSFSLNQDGSKTSLAAKITLMMLQKNLRGHEKAIFELPLFSYPTPDLMIEGFADLVVEFADFIGVIEFKSSKRLVLEPNTYLQLLAYAHALSRLKPTKFAVVLVGSPDEIIWQDYDQRAQEIFLQQMQKQPEPLDPIPS